MISLVTRAFALLALITSLWFAGSTFYYSIRGTPEEAMWVGPLLSQGSSEDHIVPWAILITFAALQFMTLTRALGLVREAGLVAQFPVGSAEAVGRAKETVNSKAAADRRLHWILSQAQHITARSSPVETLQAEASLNATGVSNSYVPLRVLVWVLPVLGFVGTAWAMSLAIGSFSQALLEVNDTKGLTLRLSQLVIPSLAHAFHITMFALSASLVGYFCTSLLQAAHEDILEMLDRRSLALATVFSSKPSSDGDFGKSIVDLDRTVASLNNCVAQFSTNGTNGHEVLRHAAERLQAASAAVQGASERLVAAAELLRKELQKPLTFTVAREERP